MTLAPANSSGTIALPATSTWGCLLCVSLSTTPENSRYFPALRAPGRHNQMRSAFRQRSASVHTPLSGCCSFGFASTRYKTKRDRRAYPMGKAMLWVSDSRDGLTPRMRCLRRSEMQGRQLLRIDIVMTRNWQRLKAIASRFSISRGTRSLSLGTRPFLMFG